MRIVLLLVLTLALACQSDAQVPTVLRIVNSIDFTANTVLSSDELRKIAGIKPGQLLATGKLQAAIDAIENAYKDRGYAATVAGNFLEPFLQTGALTIPIIEARAAEVRLLGLRKTKETAIRNFLELGRGDLYNLFALRRDAERLDALRIFESIDAAIEPTENPGSVIVVWNLVEHKKTGYVDLGGSYAASGGLIGSVTLTEANLRGRAERLSLIGSLGTVESRLGAELDYFNPWVTTNTSLSLRVFGIPTYRFANDLVNSPGVGTYFERRTGWQIVDTLRLSSSRQFALGARYERVSVDNLPLSFFAAGLPSSNGKVAAISGEFRTDGRDSLVYPTRGLLWRGFVEPGWVRLNDGGSNGILKFSGELQKFIPLARTSVQPLKGTEGPRPRVVALRLRGATSVGKLPFFEQYFLGGTLGLRGYREDRFWGKNSLLTTVEYRRPINKPLTAITFLDAGDAWGSRFQFLPGAPTDFGQHSSFSPRAGVGVGARYNSHLGQFGLDFAWGEQFRTHIVLGHAF